MTAAGEPLELRPLTRIRAQILAQHDTLRTRLDALDALADQFLRGEAGTSLELRRQLVDLELWLLSHLAFEEKHLLPRFTELDAWGAVRADEMRGDHARQRAMLESIGDDATSPARSGKALAELARGLVADLREDMAREEADLLQASLLRDDIIAVDQESD